MPGTLDDVTWPLRTERLVIRRATPSDADAVWTYRRLDEVSRYMTALPGALEDFRRVFAEAERLSSTLIIEHEAWSSGTSR